MALTHIFTELSAGKEISIYSNVVSFKGGTRYNVLDYGLVGDGVTDNSSALNTLLNTTAPTESTIHFPAGKYNYGSTVSVIDKRFNITSEFAELHTTFNGEILNIQSSLNYIQDGSRWNFDKLIFTGTGIGTAQIGIYFYSNSSNFVVNNCRFRNFGHSGIAVAITNSAFEGAGGQILDCRFYKNNIGVDLQYHGEYVSIIGGDFIENQIAITSIAGNSIITGVNGSRNGIGIQFLAGDNNGHSIISGNNINHEGTYALDLQNLPYGMTISDNHIYASDVNIVNCTGINFSGGIQDVGTYTLNSNVGTTFNNVTFVGTNGTQSITGNSPVYINCANLSGFGAKNPNTFVDGIFLGTVSTQKIGIYGKTPIIQPTVANTSAAPISSGVGTPMTYTDTIGTTNWTWLEFAQAVFNTGLLND